jgi:hypothetical protein
MSDEQKESPTPEEPHIQPLEEVKTPAEEVKTPIEKYHCNNCRVDLSSDMITKLALDYRKNEDGSLVADIMRFSIFCKQCNFFIAIVDPDASKQLQKIVKRK